LFDFLRTLKTLTLAAALAAVLVPAAHAAPDFYGVKMKSEDFAQDVFLIDNVKIPDFTNERPGTDKRIYAYGYMSGFLSGGRGISVRLYNHSDRPIATDELFREMTVVTYSGARYDRAHTEMMWKKGTLKPGEEATFNYKFPGVRLDKDEIRLVVCSFDMGETMIVLFPLRPSNPPEKKRVEEKLKQDAKEAKEPPVARSEKKFIKKMVKKKVMRKKEGAEDPAAVKECCTPVKTVQNFFRGIGDRMGGKTPPAPKPQEMEEVEIEVEEMVEVDAGPAAEKPNDKRVPPDYPLVKQEQIIEGVRYQFRPDFRQNVQEAQKDLEIKVYGDRPWTLNDPDKLFTREEKRAVTDLPRREAKVLIVNKDYGFVVVDAGFENGFGKNVVLNVIRDGRRIGKVMITKPRDKMAGALILPEWRTREEIRVGDIVGVGN
jgi:hypothetical protein